jgi:LmbE family N-acetylglucosaminyl deacetylase
VIWEGTAALAGEASGAPTVDPKVDRPAAHWFAADPAFVPLAATLPSRKLPSTNYKLQIAFVCISFSVPDLSELSGRTLVVVAHPDDEAVACGSMLQRMRNPVVVICTDGAPRDDYFWRSYGSRTAYASFRKKEAERALGAVGVRNLEFLADHEPETFIDQELFRRIPQAMQHLRRLSERKRPTAVLTLAYEGGHPDHDACNFLGRQLADELNVPAWEAPLYHRLPASRTAVQQFLESTRDTVRVEITRAELHRKRTMFAAYISQADVLETFDPAVEVLRPMANYDYSRPPHQGTLNYEAWGWPIRGWELCDQFTQYLNGEQEVVPGTTYKRTA